MNSVVESVHLSTTHSMDKPAQGAIDLLAGYGIVGDAHAGVLVQHRARVAKHPDQVNLRQVHLMHAELHDEFRENGIDVVAGAMGENITTRGIDLLGLPEGTRLHIGSEAVVEVTGLRDPCRLLNDVQDGLMSAFRGRDENGGVIRKSGIMSIVITSGTVVPGDEIKIEYPEGPYIPLGVV